MPNDWFMMNYNINAEHLFDTLGTTLKFSADYYNPNHDDYTSHFKNIFLDSIGNSSLPPSEFISKNFLDFRLLISKIDFEKKLTKTLSTDAGVKGTYMSMLSDYSLRAKNQQSGDYITDSSFTSKFRYVEKVTAAYLNLSKEIKKFNFQLGVRAENTIMEIKNNSDGLNITRTYLNLFPVLSANYNHSKNHVFSFSYNKRIERPDQSNLNPYKSFTDILNSYQGTPYTRPAYAHSLNFSYALKSSIFNSLSYTLYEHPISGYTFQNDSSKETIWNITNLDYFNVLGYSFFIRKNIKKRLVVSFNFGTYYVGYAGKINGQYYSLSAVPHYEWLNNMFILRKDVKIEVTAYYWGPWLGIANRNKARGAVSLALKKSYFDGNLNCVISVNDIFFTEVFRSYADFQNQQWLQYQSNDTRRLNISFSYNFGKIKVEKRDLGNEDEKKGLSK